MHSIPTILAEADQALGQLNEEIQRLEDAMKGQIQNLSDLKARKLQIDHLGNICQSLLAPIRRLNTDIRSPACV